MKRFFTGTLVTQRFSKFLFAWMLIALALMTPGVGVCASDGVEIAKANLEASDNGYRLSASFQFELNRSLEDAVSRGVSLYFTTDVEMTRPRWYWLDEKTIRVSQTMRISYNVLTRQYNVAILGSVQQSFSNLEDALFLIRRPNRWVVADKDALKLGQAYDVTVRMGLNSEYLSKPFQVNAINNSDWRLSSNKKHFTYKAEPQ
jgi:hypothetical protein